MSTGTTRHRLFLRRSMRRMNVPSFTRNREGAIDVEGTHFLFIRCGRHRRPLGMGSLAYGTPHILPNARGQRLPPAIVVEAGGTSSSTAPQVGPNVRPQILMPPPNYNEVADEDVIISSAREFEEAKANNNSRRNRSSTLDSEGQSSRSPNNLSKRIRVPSNPEGSGKQVSENAQSVPLPPPLPPRKKTTFTCPVCLGPIVKEMSTKCGHIFCMKCITLSILAQGKCPTCRATISSKDIMKIYLPTAG